VEPIFSFFVFFGALFGRFSMNGRGRSGTVLQRRRGGLLAIWFGTSLRKLAKEGGEMAKSGGQIGNLVGQIEI
jgi:hypothetical protein